ncbi:MAG: hypothetical protein KC486_35730, partial [Myxococcales bacterium]|nr:hypothetical protein [Myxococcales bacterium]
MPSPADLDARVAATVAALADASTVASASLDAEAPALGRLLDGGALDLAGVDPPALRVLLEALAAAPASAALRGLLLDDSGLAGAADGERIAACLKKQVFIERLDVAGSGLGDDGLAPVLAALCGRTFAALALDRIELSAALRRRLAEDVAAGTLTVEHISVHATHREVIREPELAAWLAALAPPSPLRSLDLRGYELPQGAGDRLVAALADNHRLIYLGVDLPPEDATHHARTLAAYLARNHNRAPRGTSRPPSRERLRQAVTSPPRAPEVTPPSPGSAPPGDLNPDDL